MNYQNKLANQQFNQVPGNIRNPSPRYKQNTQPPLPQVVNVPGQEPLTLAELSAADPKQQNPAGQQEAHHLKELGGEQREADQHHHGRAEP